MSSDSLLEFPSFLTEDVDYVAQKLLGSYLIREIEDENGAKQSITLKIVETESYDENDPASHAFVGKTPRNATMFGPAGHLYVYFTYGMHYCSNIVSGQEGTGSGVLIRAVEPLDHHEYLEKIRGVTGQNITNGPAKLTQALTIDKTLNGHDLRTGPLRLVHGQDIDQADITSTTRIGISKAHDRIRRFYITNNPYISKK